MFSDISTLSCLLRLRLHRLPFRASFARIRARPSILCSCRLYVGRECSYAGRVLLPEHRCFALSLHC